MRDVYIIVEEVHGGKISLPPGPLPSLNQVARHVFQLSAEYIDKNGGVNDLKEFKHIIGLERLKIDKEYTGKFSYVKTYAGWRNLYSVLGAEGDLPSPGLLMYGNDPIPDIKLYGSDADFSSKGGKECPKAVALYDAKTKQIINLPASYIDKNNEISQAVANLGKTLPGAGQITGYEPGFNSTFSISHQLPKSREFYVPDGGSVEVQISDANWVRPPARYLIDTDNVIVYLHHENKRNIESAGFKLDEARSHTFKQLPAGKYYLQIVNDSKEIYYGELLDGSIEVFINSN